MQLKKFYVYQYIDPRNSQPFYIGKGSGNRYLQHLTETKDNTENYKKWAYIQGLRNKGLEPLIEKIQENMTDLDAYALETELIKKYGRKGIDKNGILTNICIDKRPPQSPMSAEKLEALKERMQGNSYAKGKPSPFKGKKRPELSGENNHFYGKHHVDETLQIMREKAKGRIPWIIGKTHREDSKLKVKLNNPNRKAIHTPFGNYFSAEEFADQTGWITANGFRLFLKDVNKPISKRRAERSPLLTLNDIGKTPEELGYYFIGDNEV